MGKHIKILLTEEERDSLKRLVRFGNAPARTQTRARIILLIDSGLPACRTDIEIAETLLCSRNLISAIRRRFAQSGLEPALYDRPRSGRPTKVTLEIEKRLIALARTIPPEGHERWTPKVLAERLVAMGHIDSLSEVTVRTRLKALVADNAERGSNATSKMETAIRPV